MAKDCFLKYKEAAKNIEHDMLKAGYKKPVFSRFSNKREFDKHNTEVKNQREIIGKVISTWDNNIGKLGIKGPVAKIVLGQYNGDIGSSVGYSRRTIDIVYDTAVLDQLDDYRKSLGIYDSMLSIGSYREIQEEQRQLNSPTVEGKYKDNSTSLDLVTSIINSPTSNEVMKQLSKHLLPYVTANNTKVIIYSSLESKKFKEVWSSNEANIVDFDIQGYYNPSTNEIHILNNENYSENKLDFLLIHEILHSLSYFELKKNNELNKEFERYFNHASKYFNKYKEDNKTIETYAIFNKDEFLVALFTNPKFIEELEKVPALDSSFINLFVELIDSILKALKITKTDTFYNQAFSLATNILEQGKQSLNKNDNLEFFPVDTEQKQDLFYNRMDSEEDNFEEDTSDDNQEERPIGDNYTSLVAFYEKQLEEQEKNIKIVNSRITNTLDVLSPEYKENVNKVKTLLGNKRKLENTLKMLSENKHEYMYHAVYSTIKDIRESLSKDLFTIEDSESISRKLDFLSLFKQGLATEATPEDSAIITEIIKLENEYPKAFEKKSKEIMSENIFVKRMLDNLNADTVAGKAARENLKVTKVFLEDLLLANNDIGISAREMLGVISSRTSDTILPQLLQLEFQAKTHQQLNIVADLIARVDKIQEDNPDLNNTTFLLETFDNGDLTGNLLNLTTNLWNDKEKEVYKLYTNLKKATGLEKEAAYNAVFTWHKENTDVIDFTKIPEIVALYSQDPAYAKYFTSTDQEIDDYVDDLRKRLGPLYDTTVKELIVKLDFFEEQKGNPRDNFYDLNLAENNLWEFLSRYKSETQQEVNGVEVTKYDRSRIAYEYTINGKKENSSVYFKNFSNLVSIPKENTLAYDAETNTVEEQQSGYYNETFRQMFKEQDKIDLWQCFKEMSSYINISYHQGNFGKIAYPKLETTYAERYVDSFKELKNLDLKEGGRHMLSTVMQQMKAGVFTTERNITTEKEVVSNYSDSSEAYIRKTAVAMVNSGKYTYKQAEYIARQKIIKTYKTDNITKNFKAMLLEAAVHQTRQDTKPVADMMLKMYKSIKSKDNKGNLTVDRKNGIARFENFIDIIVLNKSVQQDGFVSKKKVLKTIVDYVTSTDSTPNSDMIKLLSAQDKVLSKELRQALTVGTTTNNNINIGQKAEEGSGKEGNLLQRFFDSTNNTTKYIFNGNIISKEEFDKRFVKHIQDEIQEIGLHVTSAGLSEAIKRAIVIKSLAFSPISGIHNRWEGMNSIMMMGETGEYWTPGNEIVAKEFLAFTNTGKTSRRLLSPKMKEKFTNIDIFFNFCDTHGLIEDRKDIMQKSAARKGLLTEGTIDSMELAVGLPEKKNQGTIINAIMQDVIIYDDLGNSFNFADKDGALVAFELVKGVNKLKPQFSKMYQINKDTLTMLYSQINNSVSHSQGNYSTSDAIKFNGTKLGAIALMLRKYLAEHYNQRLGYEYGKTGELNVNLSTGKVNQDGRYIKGFRENPLMFSAFGGIMAGAMLGPSVLVLGGATVGVGVLMTSIYLLKGNGVRDIKLEAKHLGSMAAFLMSIVEKTLNYPSRVFSSVPGLNKLNSDGLIKLGAKAGLNLDRGLINKTGISQEELKTISSLATELAVVINMLLIKLAIAAMIYDGDDDEKSKRRMFYYFLTNQFTRMLSSTSVYSAPLQLVSDQSRFNFLEEVMGIKNLAIYTADGDWDKAYKTFLKVAPIPGVVKNTLTGIAPWQNERDYSLLIDRNSTSGPVAWMSEYIKDKENNGNTSAQKEFSEIKEDLRDEINSDFQDITNGNKEALQAIQNKLIANNYGKKRKGQTWVEALQEFKNNGKIAKEAPKKERTETQIEADLTRSKAAFTDKLTEAGLTRSEISRVLKILYSKEKYDVVRDAID